MDIHERFEAVNDEYLKFERVTDKRSQRPDLHAFLLLGELFTKPGQNMVSSAGHDEIYLEPGGEQLDTLTDEHILDLVRCGVRHDSEFDSLCMFV